jgi:hypothetical protein
MVLALTCGSEWFGRKTMLSAVLYINLESSRGIQGRLKAWAKEQGKPLPANLSFIIDDFDLQNPGHVRAIIAVAPKNGVVIIDTLNRAAPGSDENASRDRGILIKACADIQRATGGLVVLVSHAGKDKAQGLRGHSSLYAALDAVIQIDRRSDGSRCMRLEKVKEGTDGDVHNFRLKPVVIGTDPDGNEITSCVIEPQGVGAKEDKPLAPALKYALDALKKTCEAEGKEGVHLDVWRQEFYRGHTGDTHEAKRQAFVRARSALTANNLIDVDDDFYTPRQTRHNPDTSGLSGRTPPPRQTRHTPLGVSGLSGCLDDPEMAAEGLQ